MQATIHGRTLKPVKGDITEQQADAIVNAANPPHEQHRKPRIDQELPKQNNTQTPQKLTQNAKPGTTTPNNPPTHRGEGHKRMVARGRFQLWNGLKKGKGR